MDEDARGHDWILKNSIDEDARVKHPYLSSGIPLVYLGNLLVYSYLVNSSTTPPEKSLTLQGEVGGGFQVRGLLLTTAHFQFAIQYVPLPYPRLRGRNAY